jgi:hypothetical protein
MIAKSYEEQGSMHAYTIARYKEMVNSRENGQTHLQIGLPLPLALVGRFEEFVDADGGLDAEPEPPLEALVGLLSELADASLRLVLTS